MADEEYEEEHEEPVARGALLAERRVAEAAVPWNARFHTDALVLKGPGVSIDLPIDDFLEHASIEERGLAVKKGTRRLFVFDEEARATLRAWIEPFVGKQISKNLRARIRSSLVYALLVAVGSSYGAVSWGIYLTIPALVVIVLAAFVPRREVYLAEALLWLVLAGTSILVAYANQSWIRILPAALGAFLLRQAIVLYAFYAPTGFVLQKRAEGRQARARTDKKASP